jgi:DNA polymerase III subunit epsilon
MFMFGTSFDRPQRASAVAWARDLLQSPFLVLDTETTGLSSRDDVIAVAVVNHEGKTLLNTLVKATQPIPYAATRIHGITDADVVAAPPFAQVYAQLAQLLSGQTMAVYNLDFDSRMLDANRRRSGLAPLETVASHCAMKWYACYHGEWDAWKRDFRWQKLSAACRTLGIPVKRAHSAAGDCLLTLEVIRRMAAGD